MGKKVTVKPGGYLYLTDFADLVDVSKVVFYRFKENKDKTLTLKFYDKKKKVIKPYER